MTEEQRINTIMETVARVKRGMKITKVVATRAVKTKKGDFFSGMSSAWQSTQDDAGGPGADLDLSSEAGSGMTLLEAQVAQVLLAKEASIGAWRAALSEGAITVEEFDSQVRHLKRNAITHLNQILPNNTSQG
jgi:hypothetical protein